MYNLTILLVLALVSPGLAASCDSLSNDNQRLSCYDRTRTCSAIDDARDRLACFDKLFNYVSADTTINTGKPVPAITTIEAQGQAPDAAETQKVGAERAQPMTESEPGSVDTDKIKADDLKFPLQPAADKTQGKMQFATTISDVKDGPLKMDYITLDNNQVWRETSGHSTKLKIGQSVTITEGSLGSTFLEVTGSNRKIGVRRVK